jgi:hypothetical protein
MVITICGHIIQVTEFNSEILTPRKNVAWIRTPIGKRQGRSLLKLVDLQRLLLGLHPGIEDVQHGRAIKDLASARSSLVALLYRKLRHGRGPGHGC